MDGFSIFVVRHAKDCAVSDTRHAMQHAFDLRRVDVDAAGDDHVLRAVAQIEEPVGVEIAEISSRDQPHLGGGVTLGVVLVIGEIGNVREACADFANFAGLKRVAFGVGHAHVCAGLRLSDRARMRQPLFRCAEHDVLSSHSIR